MCTNATSSSSAGIATSSSPSAYGERTVRSSGLMRSTSEPSPARVGRNGSRERGRVEAPLEHALVELARLDRAGLARRAEVRLERDRVERDEAVDEPA